MLDAVAAMNKPDRGRLVELLVGAARSATVADDELVHDALPTRNLLFDHEIFPPFMKRFGEREGPAQSWLSATMRSIHRSACSI